MFPEWCCNYSSLAGKNDKLEEIQDLNSRSFKRTADLITKIAVYQLSRDIFPKKIMFPFVL
jgi:hypothetical protein